MPLLQAHLREVGDAPDFASAATCKQFVADLNLDGLPEVIWGDVALNLDGPLYDLRGSTPPGFAHVANLDDDGRGEVFVTTAEGFVVLDTDGTVRLGPQRPPLASGSVRAWVMGRFWF